MKNYQQLLSEILATGTWQANRTGIDAISIPGAMLKFDLAEGFPAVTTKKLAFKAVVGELLGFLRGYDNAADFRALGCKIWDANANDPGLPESPNRWLTNPNRKGPDDLGRIYGVQWRKWKKTTEVRQPLLGNESHAKVTSHTEYLDQVQRAVDTIKNDPTNRRIIINAWRPDEFDQMALPPCHVLYQLLVNVERNELSMCMYQRSADSFLGVPFNIASSALFLSLMAKVTGYTPRHFTHFLADTHIYRDHVEQVELLMSRDPYKLPSLWLADKTRLEDFEPDDIKLVDYQSHEAISAKMAV